MNYNINIDIMTPRRNKIIDEIVGQSSQSVPSFLNFNSFNTPMTTRMDHVLGHGHGINGPSSGQIGQSTLGHLGQGQMENQNHRYSNRQVPNPKVARKIIFQDSDLPPQSINQGDQVVEDEDILAQEFASPSLILSPDRYAVFKPQSNSTPFKGPNSSLDFEGFMDNSKMDSSLQRIFRAKLLDIEQNNSIMNDYSTNTTIPTPHSSSSFGFTNEDSGYISGTGIKRKMSDGGDEEISFKRQCFQTNFPGNSAGNGNQLDTNSSNQSQSQNGNFGNEYPSLNSIVSEFGFRPF